MNEQRRLRRQEIVAAVIPLQFVRDLQLFHQPDHAVGLGLYWQIPLLSFVENLTVRTEYGYSLTNNGDPLTNGDEDLVWVKVSVEGTSRAIETLVSP